ncbi:YbaB/EbfC family nucleoid-associated protein [Nocardia sp. CA-084685]|uniref:YbaB/EbfC family nucleoid-associated protein n=1 Tax=Nocardia sp. CA-084685 TaxID=3239970 RepID=UPI003D9840F2
MNDTIDVVETRPHDELDRLDEFAEAIAAIRVRATSADGLVTVTVDCRGTLVELVLSKTISCLTPTEFEEVVVDTCEKAARTASAQHAELIAIFNQQSIG